MYDVTTNNNYCYYVSTGQDSIGICLRIILLAFYYSIYYGKKSVRKKKKVWVQFNQKGKIGGGLNGIEETETDAERLCARTFYNYEQMSSEMPTSSLKAYTYVINGTQSP